MIASATMKDAGGAQNDAGGRGDDGVAQIMPRLHGADDAPEHQGREIQADQFDPEGLAGQRPPIRVGLPQHFLTFGQTAGQAIHGASFEAAHIRGSWRSGNA